MGSLCTCINSDRHEPVDFYKGYDDKDTTTIDTKEGTTVSDLTENREKISAKQRMVVRATSENLENSKTNGQDVEHEKVLEVSQRDIVALKLRTTQGQLGSQRRALQANLDKLQAEAREYAGKKDREGAIFALRRRKLFEQYLTDAEEQFMVVDKAITDTESGVMTSRYVQVLRNTNELVKMIEQAEHFENLHNHEGDAMDREQKMKEFSGLFEKRHVGDVDDLYAQLEREAGEHHHHDHDHEHQH